MTVAPDNDISLQPFAVNFAANDYLLVYQPSQTPSTRKATAAQVIAALTAISFNGRTGAVTLLSADVTAALGYTPLSVAANLSDVASAATSRTNLGLGTAAVKAASGAGGVVASVSGAITAGHYAVFADTSGTVQDAGAFAGLAAANNLLDVASAGLSRKNINQGEVTLSASAASIATDCSLGNVFKTLLITGTGPYTLANPTNMVAGATYVWRITQPAGGSAQAMVYGSAFRFAAPYSNATTPPLTATLGAIDYISGVCDGTHIDAQLANNFA